MDYVSAIVPPLVMAVGFILLVKTIIKHQGGQMRSREDAIADRIIAAEAERATTATTPSGDPAKA